MELREHCNKRYQNIPSTSTSTPTPPTIIYQAPGPSVQTNVQTNPVINFTPNIHLSQEIVFPADLWQQLSLISAQNKEALDLIKQCSAELGNKMVNLHAVQAIQSNDMLSQLQQLKKTIHSNQKDLVEKLIESIQKSNNNN